MSRTLLILLLAHPASALTFSEPLAVKVGWDAQALYLGDIDRDGYQDMAIINNDRARIVVRYGLKSGEKPDSGQISIQKDKWEPMLENAPYTKRWVTTGLTAYDLHFTDINGDKKPDMVYTTDRDEVVVHLQEDKRNWSKPQPLKLRSLKNNWTTLASADLDHDGDQDLAILGKETLAVVKNQKGKLQKPSYYPCGKSTYNLQLIDINGDKKTDLTYQDPEGNEVFVRLQQNGEFPVEQVLGIESPGNMIRFANGKNPGVISLSRDTDALEHYDIDQGINDLKKSDIAMFSYTLGDTKADALRHARIDFDNDGDRDLIVADENSAELRTYLLQPNGRFTTPTISSTVNGIRTLAVSDVIPGGNLEAIVFSEEENMIGVSTIASDGSIPFPTQISLDKTPTGLTASDMDGDGSAEIIFTSDDHLHLLRWQDKKWTSTTTEIENIGEERVHALKPFDIDQDGRPDLLVLLQRDPMKILLQQGDGTFKPAPKQSGFAEKLTNRVPLHAISYGDIDQDGNDEMFICRETFARAIRLGTDGQLQVIKQINARKKKISLQGVATADLFGDSVPEILFYEKKKGTLEICDHAGESLASIDLPLTDFTALEATKRNIFIYGAGQILRIPLGQKLIQAIQTRTYQTTLKDMDYTDFRIGDLNADGHTDAVVIDSRGSHVLEVLLGSDTSWESQQHFILFEADRHYRGKRGSDYQPRDFHLVDTNSDGKTDMILHIHDRILTYLQQ